MLSRNLSYPENQFLCSASVPKEDTQRKHLRSSIHQLNRWMRRIQQRVEMASREALTHMGRLGSREKTTQVSGWFQSSWTLEIHRKTHLPLWKDGGFPESRMVKQEEADCQEQQNWERSGSSYSRVWKWLKLLGSVFSCTKGGIDSALRVKGLSGSLLW